MKKKVPKFGKWIFSPFLDVDNGEKLLHVAHRHILVFKIDAAKTIFFGFLLPLGGYFLFPQIYLVFFIWALVGFFGIIYHFIDWYYDAWLLTNLGVVDIERKGLFDMTTTRIEYHMMEGTAYNIKGFLQTLFNYGDITIDKLGAQTSVVLHDAASPKKLERKVLKCQEEYVFNRSIRDHYALKDMLSDMLAYHVQNKKVEPPKRD